MRLTIFWRVILAQCAPIALILAVSFYTLSQLHQLVQISGDILTKTAACIKLEKSLQRTFLMQMRHAEKYVLLQDKAFYQFFTEGQQDFVDTADQLRLLLDSPEERTILDQAREMQVRYATGLATASERKAVWEREKDELSDKLTTSLNELIRYHEDVINNKIAVTRDQAAYAARVVLWSSVLGLSVVVLLAYGHARGLSRPLKTLARALRRIGDGEFHEAALRLKTCKEVTELAWNFNWMANRLVELDRMKTEFMAHVSHELRTPITGIREGTALLREQIPGPITPGQLRVLNVVQTHCERLWHHIASILDFSKMDAGLMEYVRVPSALAPLITRSVESIQLLAQKKQLQVTVRVPPTLPLLAMDAARIQQVLDNLLSNAVKFTPPHGTIAITARALPVAEAEDQMVEVRVSDTGAGIPPKDQERIFDKFYQSPHHVETQHMGTGLGLAIARHVVGDHGGTIRVESQVDRGTTFVITLPRTAPVAPYEPTAADTSHGETHAMATHA